MRRLDSFSILLLAIFLSAYGIAWHSVIFGAGGNYSLDFLNVGQGDSHILTLAGGTQALFDTGPDSSVISELERLLPPSDRYIDLVFITHPEKDHFGGLKYLLERYSIGAIFWNGSTNGSEEWLSIVDEIHAQNIPFMSVGSGDEVKMGESHISILSPDMILLSGSSLNDAAIVSRVVTPSFSALLTGDIGEGVERYLARFFDLRADILKIGHHGSKFSSSEEFLHAVNPSLAVIQSGAGNSYGHPAPETLARIASSTNARIFRNDTDGEITVTGIANILRVFTETEP